MKKVIFRVFIPGDSSVGIGDGYAKITIEDEAEVEIEDMRELLADYYDTPSIYTDEEYKLLPEEAKQF